MVRHQQLAVINCAVGPMLQHCANLQQASVEAVCGMISKVVRVARHFIGFGQLLTQVDSVATSAFYMGWGPRAHGLGRPLPPPSLLLISV